METGNNFPKETFNPEPFIVKVFKTGDWKSLYLQVLINSVHSLIPKEAKSKTQNALKTNSPWAK